MSTKSEKIQGQINRLSLKLAKLQSKECDACIVGSASAKYKTVTFGNIDIKRLEKRMTEMEKWIAYHGPWT